MAAEAETAAETQAHVQTPCQRDPSLQAAEAETDPPVLIPCQRDPSLQTVEAEFAAEIPCRGDHRACPAGHLHMGSRLSPLLQLPSHLQSQEDQDQFLLPPLRCVVQCSEAPFQ